VAVGLVGALCEAFETGKGYRNDDTIYYENNAVKLGCQLANNNKRALLNTVNFSPSTSP
jgi:hypothetical protein